MAPPRILTWLAVALLFAASSIAFALPPVGITQLGSVRERTARIAIHDQVAYVSTSAGIQPIDQGGLLSQITPVGATFSSLTGTTRVVKDSNGKLFYGASFDEDRMGLYPLDNPSSPTITWPFIRKWVGFDSSLQGYTVDRIFQTDGTVITPIPYSTPYSGLGQFFASDVTPSGFVWGAVAFDGTAGGGPALRHPNATLEVLGTGGITGLIRERLDGDGVNIGFNELYANVRYGSRPVIDIDKSIDLAGTFDDIIVSESDFTIVRMGDGHSVFYPGVNPAGIDRSVPLLDFFPELQSAQLRRGDRRHFDRRTDSSTTLW